MNKRTVKRMLWRFPPLWHVVSFVYTNGRPHTWWVRYRNRRFQSLCYAKFQAGEKVLHVSYGDIRVAYEAISPNNYWHLAMGNEHEDKFMTKILKDYVRRGDIVLDIGAHTGMYTIPLAKAVAPDGKVYAFEPEGAGYNAVKRNAEINLLTNIVTLNIAVSDREGEISFFVRPDKDTHSIFEKTTAPSPLGIQERVSVKTSSIDRLVETGGIEQPDFVKVDVEGAELLVLAGMEQTVARVRAILVEIHENALMLQGFEDPNGEVEKSLRCLGFTHMEHLDDCHVLASRPASRTAATKVDVASLRFG